MTVAWGGGGHDPPCPRVATRAERVALCPIRRRDRGGETWCGSQKDLLSHDCRLPPGRDPGAISGAAPLARQCGLWPLDILVLSRDLGSRRRSGSPAVRLGECGAGVAQARAPGPVDVAARGAVTAGTAVTTGTAITVGTAVTAATAVTAGPAGRGGQAGHGATAGHGGHGRPRRPPRSRRPWLVTAGPLPRRRPGSAGPLGRRASSAV